MNRSILVLLAALGCTGTPKDDTSLDGGPTDGEPTDEPTEPTGPVDSDGDGLSDEDEVAQGLDPQLADSDEDGLGDAEEVDGPTDPLDADSDDDWLSDGDEIDVGSDPMLPDTDGDTYLDGDEVAEDRDPTDAASVIYQGGWPYNRDKEAMGNPGFGGSVAVGALFPDLVGVDQFGDEVHLYDFAADGRPVIIDFSAMWCGPCHALADYLGGVTNDFPFPGMREALESGEIRWITVMLQNVNGGDGTGQDSLEWSTLHPDETIPVLAPLNPAAPMNYIGLYYFPSILWLDASLTVAAWDIDPYVVMEEIEAEFGD